jgi:hypothetical protein
MNNFGNFNVVTPILALTFSCVAFGFLIGALVYKNNNDETIKKQAIENQCAQYNSTSGEFEWIKK